MYAKHAKLTKLQYFEYKFPNINFYLILIICCLIILCLGSFLTFVGQQCAVADEESPEFYNQVHEKVVKRTQYNSPQTNIVVSPTIPATVKKQGTSTLLSDNLDKTYIQTLFKDKGVNFFNGKKETYYSSNVKRHYKTDQWHLDSNNFWKTDTENFVVASSDYPIGTKIETSMGTAEVLDCGCAHDVIDFYVCW